jgi:hypothetical protein
MGALSGVLTGKAVWVLKEVHDTLFFTSKEDLEAYCEQQKEEI